MTFYFGILSSFLFFPIARNLLNVKAEVSVFFTTLLVDWPHHLYYTTDINSDSRGSKSNWWVSEKRNAVTLGRAGYIDNELIVYKSITVSQKSSHPGRANTILAPLATPVCLAGNWLISQISMHLSMHLSKYCPSNHCIVSASLEHLPHKSLFVVCQPLIMFWILRSDKKATFRKSALSHPRKPK